jgi:hypothetical protein
MAARVPPPARRKPKPANEGDVYESVAVQRKQAPPPPPVASSEEEELAALSSDEDDDGLSPRPAESVASDGDDALAMLRERHAAAEVPPPRTIIIAPRGDMFLVR